MVGVAYGLKASLTCPGPSCLHYPAHDLCVGEFEPNVAQACCATHGAALHEFNEPGACRIGVVVG